MRFTFLTFAALSVAGLSSGASHKLAAELQRVDPDAAVEIIVRYRQAPTAAHHSRITARGGELKQNLDIIRAAHYSVAARELDAISEDPDIESITQDHAIFATWKPVYSQIYTGKPDYGWKTAG